MHILLLIWFSLEKIFSILYWFLPFLPWHPNYMDSVCKCMKTDNKFWWQYQQCIQIPHEGAACGLVGGDMENHRILHFANISILHSFARQIVVVDLEVPQVSSVEMFWLVSTFLQLFQWLWVTAFWTLTFSWIRVYWIYLHSDMVNMHVQFVTLMSHFWDELSNLQIHFPICGWKQIYSENSSPPTHSASLADIHGLLFGILTNNQFDEWVEEISKRCNW